MRIAPSSSLNRQFFILVAAVCLWVIAGAGVGLWWLLDANHRLVQLAEQKADDRALLARLDDAIRQLTIHLAEHPGPLEPSVARGLDQQFRDTLRRLPRALPDHKPVSLSWRTLLERAVAGQPGNSSRQRLALQLDSLGDSLADQREAMRIATHDIRQRALALTLLGTLLGVGLGAWVVMRRVRSLSDQLHRLGRGMAITAVGDFGTRVTLGGCSELDALSEGFNHMVEQLQQQDHQLRLREQGLLTVMNSAPDAIITIDLKGRVISWNAAAERLFVYRESDMRGEPLQAIFDPGQHADFSRILTECWAFRGDVSDGSAGPWELTVRRKDGLHMPVEITLRDMEANGQQGLVVVARDITERKAAAEKLAFLTQHDSLTQLPNRALIRDLLVRAMQRADSSDRLVGVMIMGINRFTDVNDQLGHALGDALLVMLADRVNDSLRRHDYLGRIGGDEFCIIVSDMRHVDQATQLTEHLAAVLAEPFRLGGHEVFVSVSLGVAIYPFDDASPEQLLKHASAAMNRCKRQGDTHCLFYADAMNRRSTDRIRLTAELKRAVESEQFRVHYQPLLDTVDGRVTGAEALLRWAHPERGLLRPAEFIDLLEETGLIIQVGRWVLDQALRQTGQWLQQGLGPLRISINLSARQFSQPGFVQEVEQATADLRCSATDQSGTNPASQPLDCLEFELTEGVLMEHTEASLNTLYALKDLGIKLSVDDFGTGYSSLSYLKQFPIDALKIDQSFVQDIGRSQDAELIVQAIIDLAHNLRMKVVGEGVETEQQRSFLRSKGCDVLQGHLYGEAMPADAFEAYLKAQRADAG